jgi:cell division protein FtsL
MKNLIIALLAIATLTFAGLYTHERNLARQAQNDVTTLNQNVVEMQTRLDEQEHQAGSLQKHLETTRATAIAKADEITQLQQVITNQTTTPTNEGNVFGEMLKSPEMKKMIQTQQQNVLGPMIEKNYASFFSGLQLTPEQSTALKDLIVKRSLVDANMGVSLLGGGMDGDKRKELMDQAKSEKDGINDQIKQFLGGDNYTQFESYEKTIPDRMMLNSYKDVQGQGAGALTPDQEQQLLQAMGEERQKFKFTTDFSDQSKFNGDFSSMFTEDKITQFQTEREQLDKYYLQRAQGILTQDQLGPFEKFLTSQRDMQSVGMKMAAKMFGGKGK